MVRGLNESVSVILSRGNISFFRNNFYFYRPLYLIPSNDYAHTVIMESIMLSESLLSELWHEKYSLAAYRALSKNGVICFFGKIKWRGFPRQAV